MPSTLLDLPTDALHVISSYLSIETILTACNVSRQFNKILTNVNTVNMKLALKTVLGWWYLPDDMAAFDKVSMCDRIISLELLCGCKFRCKKSLYIRILQLYYVDPFLRITFLDLISNLEIKFDIYDIAGTGKGTTGNFDRRLFDIHWYEVCHFSTSPMYEYEQYFEVVPRYKMLPRHYRRTRKRLYSRHCEPKMHVTDNFILNHRLEHPKDWELAVVVPSMTCIDLT